MDRVVFLDRDGTINEEVNYLHRPEDLRIFEGVPQALASLKRAGFVLVVVTNQAGIARGYYTEKEVDVLHRYLNGILERYGAGIDAYYYCPHHPEAGIGPYRRVCRCRKPGIGMFESAQERFAVDKARSYMIGDKESDILAGKNYGVRSILVGTGYGAELKRKQEEAGQLPIYDYYAENMSRAAEYILRGERR